MNRSAFPLENRFYFGYNDRQHFSISDPLRRHDTLAMHEEVPAAFSIE